MLILVLRKYIGKGKCSLSGIISDRPCKQHINKQFCLFYYIYYFLHCSTISFYLLLSSLQYYLLLYVLLYLLLLLLYLILIILVGIDVFICEYHSRGNWCSLRECVWYTQPHPEAMCDRQYHYIRHPYEVKRIHIDLNVS